MYRLKNFLSYGLGTLFVSFFVTASVFADDGIEKKEFVSIRVQQPPLIDGTSSDPAWSRAKPLTTKDPVAGIEITLKSVYTKDELFILATFPDPNENREHKTMIWDPDLKRYTIGPKREDTFVIKWNMEPFHVDLSLHGDTPYEADIWYWKAHRTDHAGYADDKHQIYSLKKIKNSKKLLSKMGRRFYLVRKGDKGTAAYKAKVLDSYSQDQVPLYDFTTPAGSRADVKAKGKWQNGFWTVEFSRKLTTGNRDDIQLDPRNKYCFGVSRFEIAGRKINPAIEEPKFGSGEVNEHFVLQFKE